MIENEELFITGFIFSLLGILISITGWFIVDYLTRNRIKSEKEYSIKVDNYRTIFDGLNELLLYITIYKKSYDLESEKQLSEPNRTMAIIGLSYGIPSASKLRKLSSSFEKSFYDTANETIGTISKLSDVNKIPEESLQDLNNELINQLIDECVYSIKENILHIGRAINSLRLIGQVDKLILNVERVLKKLTDRFHKVSARYAINELGIPVKIDDEESLEQWLQDASEQIKELLDKR